MSQKWTASNIPNQRGKVVIVTGANSGIGYETAKVLAEKGATAIMACRNLDKANEAADNIRRTSSADTVEVMQLDLGDLNSVRQFVENFLAKYGRLDLLINNAGIMMPPYGKTAQGFETQFGVNHLGHFALTGLLIDKIRDTPGSRIVTVSSNFHRFGTLDFDDLQWEKKAYRPNAAYGQSKLVNLLFAYELQRKLQAVGADTLSIAAHPGWTETNLQQHAGTFRFLNRFLAQDAPMGALPTLYAATATDVLGGDYYGPKGLMELRGHPQKVQSSAASHNTADAEKLWAVSEELTAVHYL